MNEEAGRIDDFLDLACLAYKGADEPGRRRKAQALLASEPDLKKANIHTAAVTGSFDVVRSLLQTDPTLVSKRGGPRDWDALLYLSYGRIDEGHDTLRLAQLLLEHGADPNTHFMAWGSPFTALTGVMGEGEQGLERLPPHPKATALAECLLRGGASPNESQGLYNTMFQPDDSWLRLLLANGLNAEHDITWMKPGTVRTLDFVLAHAAVEGFAERVDLLLAHGANPRCLNSYSSRPIIVTALMAGQTAIVERLQRAGAGPIELNDSERFQRACEQGNRPLAERLLSENPGLLEPTLVVHAAVRGQLESVALLLDLGADVNGQTAGGVTPLHKAAEAGHVELVRDLIARGADLHLRDSNYNATPLAWAEHAGQQSAARILRLAESDLPN